MQKGKELNDFQRNPLEIEILSNLRFGSLEIGDTSVTRVTNNFDLTSAIQDHSSKVEMQITVSSGDTTKSWRPLEKKV
jgi:hypothetical protein